MFPKVEGRPKGPPFGFFRHYATFFPKIFEFYQREPPLIFLKLSVRKKRLMSLKGLFLDFSELCDFFYQIHFLKNFNFSQRQISFF